MLEVDKLAKLVKYYTSNNLLLQWSSGQAPKEITFFEAVKSFDAYIAISGNFVITLKNLSIDVLRKIRLRKSPLMLITPLNAEAAEEKLWKPKINSVYGPPSLQTTRKCSLYCWFQLIRTNDGSVTLSEKRRKIYVAKIEFTSELISNRNKHLRISYFLNFLS